MDEPPQGDAIDPRWETLIGQIAHLQDPEAIIDTIYRRYCEQPHSDYDPDSNTEGARIFGALGYAYDADLREVRLHFFGRRGTVSALSSRHTQQRRADFKRLLEDVRERHPDAERLKSSTWLQNVPNYRNLFPQSFADNLRDIGGSTYFGIWGQFVRGDGSGNRERLAEFREALASASTLDEAVRAFPLKVLEGVGPLRDFYLEYGL